MSQPAAQALDDDLSFDLVYSDGWPLDSNWERIQIDLLIDVIRQAMAERARTDFFTGGNMFVYHSVEQARDVTRGRPYLRGPDVFFVNGVEDHDRKAWISWQEEGRLPDLIVELLSPSTARIDRTVKRDLYAKVFRTPEYFLYEPRTKALDGLRLAGDTYLPVLPDADRRIWSEQLGLKLGGLARIPDRGDQHLGATFRRSGSDGPHRIGSRAPAGRSGAPTGRGGAPTGRRRASTGRGGGGRARSSAGETGRWRG